MKRYNLMNMKISKWLIVPFLSVMLIVSSCQDIIELELFIVKTRLIQHSDDDLGSAMRFLEPS